MRIGILGGTFNPIHYAHLRAAEEVREALGLEEVRFVSSAHPPHKPDEKIAPARDRLEMVRLATEDHPTFVCDPIEVDRGGVSYTVDTLSALAEGPCRGGDLFLIVGGDAFAELHTWHQAPKLLRMTHLAVTLRGGQRAEDVLATLRRTLKPQDASLRFEPIGENQMQVSGSDKFIQFVPISTLDISGTHIRRLARVGASLRYLLPPAVELFIIRRGLYGAEAQVPAGQQGRR